MDSTINENLKDDQLTTKAFHVSSARYNIFTIIFENICS